MRKDLAKRCKDIFKQKDVSHKSLTGNSRLFVVCGSLLFVVANEISLAILVGVTVSSALATGILFSTLLDREDKLLHSHRLMLEGTKVGLTGAGNRDTGSQEHQAKGLIHDCN